MIKKSTSKLFIIDRFDIDLNINKERAQNFIKDQTEAVNKGASKLYVQVKATHAGIITRNNAFYRPDIMKNGLETFTKPFNKPVQIHHDSHSDPVGRVISAKYVDTSHMYVEPIMQFKEYFGGKIFTDMLVQYDTAKEQIKWVYDNLMKMDDYSGLGYGEVGMNITDPEAIQKVLDQRYLTVSVGFGTDKAMCSICDTNWAEDGPCEHQPGKIYDKYPMVLIPDNFNYEEISWVNAPADPHVEIESIIEANLTQYHENQQDSKKNKSEIKIKPILLGVDGSQNVFRLDFLDEVQPQQNQEVEVIEVKNQKPKTFVQDGHEWPDAARHLFNDSGKGYVSRKHYLAEKGDADHKHRVIIDPVTGNGYTDFIDDHAHEVVDMKVKMGSKYRYNEEEGRGEKYDEHTHPMGDEIPKLGYDSANSDKSMGRPVPDGQATDRKKKKMKKKKIRKSYDSEDQVPETGAEEKLIDINDDIPEGWELVEEVEVDAEDQKPPQSKGSKGRPKKMKKKKKAGKASSAVMGGQVKKDEVEYEDVIELEIDDEIPEGYELIEEFEVEIEDELDVNDDLDYLEMEFDDSFTEDKDKFYDEFVVPILKDEGFEDKELSSEERKNLPKSAFCGPNRSFPIPDCAHVTAARRLIGRYKGEGSKTKIKACIERKARSLGCDKKEDKVQDSVVKFSVADNEYAVSDLNNFDKVLASLGKEVITENKDSLYEVAKIFGVTEEAWEEALGKDEVVLGTGETQDLDDKIDDLDDKGHKHITDEVINDFVGRIVELDEDHRLEIIEKLLDALKEKELIPDYDQEFADLVQERDELSEKVKSLTKSNKDLYLSRQRWLAETVVSFREQLNKDGYTELNDESREKKIEELQVRSIDSLNDSLNDLTKELKNTDKIDNSDNGSVDNTIPVKDAKEEDDKDKQSTKIDLMAYQDVDEASYKLARMLQDATKRSGKAAKRQG